MSGASQRTFGQQSRHGGNIVLKLVLLGESGVGKSTIAIRFVHGTYPNPLDMPNIAGSTLIKHTIPGQGGQTVRLNIWDTAGQERFDCIAQVYYRRAQGVIVVYDISLADTFNKAMKWIRELKTQTAENMVIVLAGNKADLAAEHRAVQTEDARAYAEENGLMFAEVSAKTGLAITEIFMMIANKLADRQGGGADEGQVVRLSEPKEGKKSGCKF